MVNITLTNVSIYCTASIRAILEWCMMSTNPPGIMFVKFFDEKHVPAMDKYITVIPARIVCRYLNF